MPYGVNVPMGAQPSQIGNLPGGPNEAQTLASVLGKAKGFGTPSTAAVQQAGGAPQGAGSPTLASALPSMAAQQSPSPPPPSTPQDSDASSQDDTAIAPTTPSPGRSPASQNPAVQAQAQKALNPSNDDAASQIFASLSHEIPKDQKDAAQRQSEDELAAEHFKGLANDPEMQRKMDEFSGTENEDAPAWVKFLGGMPKTAEGRLGVFQKIYGQDNAKFQNGQFMYRKDDKAPWAQVSSDAFDLASNAPDIIQGLAGGAAGTLGAGAAIGASGGVGALAAGGIYAAGEAVGQGAAAGVRDLINHAMGVQEAKDFSVQKDVAYNAGFGALASGFGQVVSKGISALKNIGGALIDGTVENRMALASATRDAVDQIHSEIRMPDPSMTPHSVGQGVKNAVDHQYDYLSSRVDLVKNTALSQAEQQGKTAFKIDNGLSQMRKVIGDKAIEDGTTGQLSLAANSFDGSMEASAYTQLKSSQAAGWGDPAGQSVLKDMVNRYNVLSAASKVNGGIKLKDLYDTVSYMGDKAAFNETSPLNGEILNNFKSVRNAFASGDMKSALDDVLQGTPYHESWQKDMQNYASKIDTITALQGKFNSPDSAESIAKGLLQPGQTDTVAKVSQILGSDSPEMGKLRSMWLSQRIDDAIDPARPVFNGEAFKRSIDPNVWGQEMLDHMVPEPGQLNRLKVIANNVAKLPTSDFWTKNADGMVAGVGSLAGVLENSPVIAAKNMYRLTRTNPAFADYMAQNGVSTLIKGAESETMKQNILKGMGIYESLIDNSTLATVGKVGNAGYKAGKILVPATARAIGAAGMNQMANPDDGLAGLDQTQTQ